MLPSNLKSLSPTYVTILSSPARVFVGMEEITSLSELEAAWDELLQQYASLKSLVRFCQSVKDRFGTESDSDPGGDVSHVEHSLVDTSHIEEKHYEDLAQDLESEIQSSTLVLDKLCQECDEVLAQANRLNYFMQSRDFRVLEQEYANVEQQLAQLTSDHAEKRVLLEVKLILEKRCAEARRHLASVRVSDVRPSALEESGRAELLLRVQKML